MIADNSFSHSQAASLKEKKVCAEVTRNLTF